MSFLRIGEPIWEAMLLYFDLSPPNFSNSRNWSDRHPYHKVVIIRALIRKENIYTHQLAALFLPILPESSLAKAVPCLHIRTGK